MAMRVVLGNVVACHFLGTLGAWALLAPAALAILPSLPTHFGIEASPPTLLATSILGASLLLAAARRLPPATAAANRGAAAPRLGD